MPKIALRSAPNLIYNAEGLLFQRTDPATPTNINDDVYGPDRWNILASANAVAISRSTDAPDGCRNAIKLDKATSSGFFGMEQILPANESIPLRSKTVSFGLSVKTESSEVSQIRIAIVGWEGTADTVTSDIISSWAATPTYIANVTEYGSALLSVTNSYQEVKVTATVGASCNNLIFLIHTTNSEATSDSLFLSKIRGNEGPTLVRYSRRKGFEEIALCQRFYEKSYELDTVPGTATSAGQTNWTTSGTSVSQSTQFKVVKFSGTVTGTSYNPTTGTINEFRTGTSNISAGSSASQTGIIITGTASGDQLNARYQWTAESEL